MGRKLRSILRNEEGLEREREKREIFSTRAPRFFEPKKFIISFALRFVPRDIVSHVLFFRHGFLWKWGDVRWQGNSPRGWRMFCNFSGLLVSRAVLLIETKFSPPWLIGRIRFFPFRIARICQVFFSFFFFFDFFVFFFFFFCFFFWCDKYHRFRSDAKIRYLRWYKWCKGIFQGKGFLDIFTLKIYIPGVLTVEIYVEARIFIKLDSFTTGFQIENV